MSGILFELLHPESEVVRLLVISEIVHKKYDVGFCSSVKCTLDALDDRMVFLVTLLKNQEPTGSPSHLLRHYLAIGPEETI